MLCWSNEEGKRLVKIELKGTKILPDGLRGAGRVAGAGNAELGPSYRAGFGYLRRPGSAHPSRTIFKNGHVPQGYASWLACSTSAERTGKYYRRLKLAIGPVFIPLRIRGAITATEREEDIKWLNVFQEASFSLDRTTGVCSGSVTWTDKVIQSMNYGFFRFLDADRYMELDGITAKHLYRYLAGAFEKKSVIVEDAREACQEPSGNRRTFQPTFHA